MVETGAAGARAAAAWASCSAPSTDAVNPASKLACCEATGVQTEPAAEAVLGQTV
jgi:hypothetical protein